MHFYSPISVGAAPGRGGGVAVGAGMSYYRALGLEREPFSTSPDPAFLYLSAQHRAALCKLQIAVGLKRGMSAVLGDVGTGKTTLSRRLSQVLSEEKDVQFHMILNPYFRSERQFLDRLSALFRATPADGEASEIGSIEAIERRLFQLAVEEQRTVVLLVDEAQLLPDFALEILRILLNYETNEFKLLQLILVGQLELLPRLQAIPNFWDRIAMKFLLRPLDRHEVQAFIDFRLRQAGYRRPVPLFTREAMDLIAAHTRGYPRRLAMLCHNALEYLVMHDEVVVVRDTIRDLIDAELSPAPIPAVEQPEEMLAHGG